MTQRTLALSITMASLLALFSAPSFAKNEFVETESKISAAVPPGTLGSLQKAESIKRDKALVYKQVLADGRVIYGDEPIKGRPVEKVIEVDLRSTATWAAKTDMSKESPAVPDIVDQNDGPSPVKKSISDADQQAANKLAKASDDRAKATARLLVAEERFARANADLANAQTPLDGDRLMNINGTSRLGPAYFDRIAKARLAAEQASLEYDAALSAARYHR